MMYKAKVAVCSDIRTKHSTQSERHVEFLNVKPERRKTARVQKVNWLVFITVVESVYCAVRADSLYKADYVSSLKG